jgi:hypothetical protein
MALLSATQICGYLRNKTEISGHSLLAATECADLGERGRVAFSLLEGMGAMVAAVWDQPSGLEIIAQK